MPRLVVFDIDGTLTDTNAVDDECYRAAIAEMLQIEPAAVEWEDAAHITDTGIAHWCWQRHRQRAPSSGELDTLRDCFLAYLAAAVTAAPTRFGPIKGARGALDSIRDAGWTIALATGGWSASARLKLSAAGLDVDGVAFASSDDSSSRDEILRIAIRRAQTSTPEGFHRVVSVGDAAWDVRCASSVGVAFVGIGMGERAALMQSAGAASVLPDLATPESLLAALHAAVVPAAGVRAV